jgi:hypothetical protein
MTQRRTIAVILLILAACAEPTAAPEPAGGHRLAGFPPFELDQPPAVAVEDRQSALHCDAEETWCAQLRRDGDDGEWRLEVHEGSPINDAGVEPRRFEPSDQARGDPAFAIWPHIVRAAGGAVMVGVLTTRRMGFSGGGASETRLTLVRAEPGAAPLVDVLEVPVEAGSMVRACFGEEDMQLRAEACHDEYEFAGTLALDPAAAAGPPRFVLATRARTYPGRAFRLTDAQAADREQRRWARSDLVWADDPECSYRRTYLFDAAAGRYRPETPPPACDDYLGSDWPGPPPPVPPR